MVKYKTHKIEQVKGKVSFLKLFENEDCLFDNFMAKVEKSGDIKLLAKIYTLMNIASQGLQHKNTKPLQGFGEVEDFEIKVDHYRIYYFTNDSGQIVVLGGGKKTQKKDIAKFREIKEDYLRKMGE